MLKELAKMAELLVENHKSISQIIERIESLQGSYELICDISGPYEYFFHHNFEILESGAPFVTYDNNSLTLHINKGFPDYKQIIGMCDNYVARVPISKDDPPSPEAEVIPEAIQTEIQKFTEYEIACIKSYK